jgi:hypothetical protein
VCGIIGRSIKNEIKIEEFYLWDVTSRSPLKVNRCFGGTCRLRLQDRRVSFVTSFQLDILLGLFLDSEDGGDMFVRNVC